VRSDILVGENAVKKTWRAWTPLAVLSAMVICASAVPRGSLPETTANQSEIERGRYLAEEIAKCSECHTARNEQGELRQDSWLRGAPIWIRPVAPIRNWADRAPALAGLPSFTDEQAERVLEQGIGPEGEELRPPMHIYHMNHADAKAIVAYLKSLPRGPSTE
jgi:mono/diheme cytochrome c family protein